jgi:hypothetical protein
MKGAKVRNLKKDIDRNLLLDQLRKAVTLQIELWDVRLALAETLERAFTDVEAQHPIDARAIVLLVGQHRNTIGLESEIQRAMHYISGALGRALQDVASQVREMCVMADTGLELTAADLDEFLGEVPTCERIAGTPSSHYC